MKTDIVFLMDWPTLDRALRRLKRTRCPHCGRIGTLNRHDTMQGNDWGAHGKQGIRGRRAWCSNRGRRKGCGRTTAFVLADVLPRHGVRAPMLGRLLDGLRRGGSVSRIWNGGRFAAPVETIYHLLQRLRRRLDWLRATLCRICSPPPSGYRDPLRQTAEHLHCAFPTAPCPVAAFQYAFQTPFMG